jgi:hypothetical protein
MNSIEDPKIAAERLMQRAYNRDGLPELAIGLILMLYASFMFGISTLMKGGWPASIAFMLGSGLGLPLLGWTIQQRLSGWVRSRYLTPRLGYVRHKPREREPVWHVILLSLACAFVMGPGFLIFKRWDKWFLLLAGCCWGAGRIGFGRRLGVPRFVVTGILSALLGGALSLTNLTVGIAVPAWFGATGLVEFASGCVVLFHLLAESPGAEAHDAD